jgi:hypothetical protein
MLAGHVCWVMLLLLQGYCNDMLRSTVAWKCKSLDCRYACALPNGLAVDQAICFSITYTSCQQGMSTLQKKSLLGHRQVKALCQSGGPVLFTLAH